jgi:DNA-directed RNA polymerase subunit M/transcription elongation factor TFIIS
MTKDLINSLKDTYQPGIRIRLLSMEREPQMPQGLTGTVTFVDDAGQIHVAWEDGSSLAIICGVDNFLAFYGPTAGEYLREKYGPDDEITFREGEITYRVVIIGVDRLIEELERYADKICKITSKLAAVTLKPYNTVTVFDAFLNDHVLTDERALEIKMQREFSEGQSEQWHCPKCGTESLFYGQTKLEDSYVVNPWTCKTCGAKGKEFGRIEFDGHYVDNLPINSKQEGGSL